MKTSLVVLLLVGITLQSSIFRKVTITDPTAVCLDGSPSAYYISEGGGDTRNKFLLYFEGGGWCGADDLASTIESCYQRSRTDLGSSKNYPQIHDFTQFGVLSGDSGINPEFYNWTRVFITYCDGSGHQGTKSQPVDYKGTRLYFRGANNTIAKLRSLNDTLKLFASEDIIVTGGSAGGLAAFHWSEYVKIHASGYVWSVPDSGIFLDVVNVTSKDYSYRNRFINLMKLSNAEVAPPNAGCASKYATEPWRCMFAQYLHPFLSAPQYPIMSLYDTWSIANIVGINCIDNSGSLKPCTADQKTIIEQYKKNTTSVLEEMAKSDKNSAWAISCATHGFLTRDILVNPNWRVPAGSQNSILLSIAAWILSEPYPTHIDNVSWPSNPGCAGFAVNLITEES